MRWIIVLVYFLSFIINDWKEKMEMLLKNSPLWEEIQSFICSCQPTVNGNVFCLFLQMLSTAATIEVSVFTCSVFCHVNLLARTIFENICFPFFLHKSWSTSVSRQHWSCEEIPSSQNSDKAALFSSEVLGPVHTSCFCRAELNFWIKFDISTAEAWRLNLSF